MESCKELVEIINSSKFKANLSFKVQNAEKDENENFPISLVSGDCSVSRKKHLLYGLEVFYFIFNIYYVLC